jgi:signal transduction histidine kinase
MDSAPEFLNLFVEPTVELIYFLAVFVISQAAMLMALGQRLRGKTEIAAGHYAALLAGVVLAWLAMGVGGLVALIANAPDEAILPPLERAVNVLVILFASAGLLAADSERSERRLWQALAAASLMVVVAYLITAARWYGLAEDHDFNCHALGFAWTFAPGLLIFGIVGLLIAYYKNTADIPLKLVFFAVLLIGYSYTAARMSADRLDGHTSGALRLAFLTAMPVLTIIVYRLVIERLTAAIDEVSEYAEAVSKPHAAVQAPPPRPAPMPVPARSMSAGGGAGAAESMALLRAIGMMLDKEDPENIPRQIATAIATVLKADIAVLLSLEDAAWADVLAAYDHIQQRLIPGLALHLEEQPTLVNAVESKSQRLMVMERHLNELIDFYTRLDIKQLGPAYIQPLMRSGVVVGVVMVGLPYTSRELLEPEVSLLEGLAPVAARLLTLSRSALRLRAEAEDRALQTVVLGESPDGLDQRAMIAMRQEMQASLELAQEQIGELSRRVSELQTELDFERSRLAALAGGSDEAMSITQRIEALSQERHQLAAEREQLSRALQEAQTTLVSATAEDDQDVYATMIESLRRERDELQVQKVKLERHLEDIRSTKETAVPDTLRAMLTELTETKARLSAERDALQSDLEDVQAQLRSLGIEGGPLAVAKALGQITEERAYYKARAEKFAQERDLLLEERKKLEDQIGRETEREAQLVALESDIRRLATDREALVKQRDTFRAERDHLVKQRETWFAQRARLIGEATVVKEELDSMIFELNQVKADQRRLGEERAAFDAERDRWVAESTALRTERDQLLARAEGNRELLEQLGADGVGALKTMIEGLTVQRQQLEQQLLQAQQDYALLEQQASRPPTGSTAQITRPVAPDNAEVITSIAQELRTPMSAILGYTDLLLGESVGILGGIQLQFLQRVRANIDRLSNLINDLISITMLDSQEFKLEPITIDLLEVIEDAITAAGMQFRERNITLRMNLNDHLPSVRADRDAMHQVIVQLLSNAYLASPASGEVLIAARPVRQFAPPPPDDASPLPDPINGALVSVTDQGGGVPPDEQRRVFGRLYRADNPLIEGIGDTGVGLSIAKALIEAHRGRIWLESDPEQGTTTFHFILPLAA